MDPIVKRNRGWFGLCDHRITDQKRSWWATFCGLKKGHAGEHRPLPGEKGIINMPDVDTSTISLQDMAPGGLPAPHVERRLLGVRARVDGRTIILAPEDFDLIYGD